MMIKKKVVIVGGGFGGFTAAKKLSNKLGLEVLLVDSTNHHLFQPLLYQVACAALHPADIAFPIREILKNAPNITVIMSEVVKVQKETQHIELKSGEMIPYDYLILAVGARHHYFGHDEWEKYAPGLKSLGDALEIRKRMLVGYERLESCKFLHMKNCDERLNFVIIGGGPTGVELAGAISEIARYVLRKNFRMIHPEETKIILIEGSPRVLSQFSPELSHKAAKDLESLGVTIMTNTRVDKIDNNGVYIGDQLIPTKEVFWAAGNAASPLLSTLNTSCDHAGRVIVEKDLSVPGHPELFVIGDAACALDPKGVPFPGLASVATQQGCYVANLIREQKSAENRPPFKYLDRGMLATIGKKRAIGIIFGWEVTGFLAWMIWNFVHLTHIIGFGNKLMVMTEWAYDYITGSRVSRLIYRNFGNQSKGSSAIDTKP